MDHSPSEQLSGDPLQWHTSVLVVSETAHQWALAPEIARSLRIQSGQLKKWTRTTAAQKEGFARELGSHIKNGKLTIYAVSAQERLISRSCDEYVAQLGMQDHYRAEAAGGNSYSTFGPFLQSSYGVEQKEVTISIPTSQAAYVLHLAHFFIRKHQLHKREVAPLAPFVDWQISPDRMPGDIGGKMFSAFRAVLSASGGIEGSWRFLTFRPRDRSLPKSDPRSLHPDKDPGSQLADNIAGHLQDCLFSGRDTPLHGENFSWEIWTPADIN